MSILYYSTTEDGSILGPISSPAQLRLATPDCFSFVITYSFFGHYHFKRQLAGSLKID